ncbi:MAG TPA: lipocalin-like domain-containing protein [Acidobacteriaceae bacterium]|jgi:predicted secreted hydrolase|nr:lipocalin-like domain-containing protein [Acidobacteriaceae bacterium]
MRSSPGYIWIRCAAIVLLLLAVTGHAADYDRALPGYHYQFPRDNFDHPRYQTEWWYYTGNIASSNGHRFGFELTFFRQGISRRPNPSPWYVHDLYLAHFALSDLTGGRYQHAERINRAGPGIAGADAAQHAVWNGNWRADIEPNSQQLQAMTNDCRMDLRLTPVKPIVIQGRNGISRKAAGVGHASHYLSFSRLLTSGSIRVQGVRYTVSGTSWMDHEFFTGSMAPDEEGWDWVGLQLDNGTELMLYRMRHKDGSVDPFSSGSYIDAGGRSTFLASADFSMRPDGDFWTSPHTRGRYPLRWHIAVPRFGLDCTVTTSLDNQELSSRFGPSYWEGAVTVQGRQSRALLRGVGYLEMTGYAPGAANIEFP